MGVRLGLGPFSFVANLPSLVAAVVNHQEFCVLVALMYLDHDYVMCMYSNNLQMPTVAAPLPPAVPSMPSVPQ